MTARQIDENDLIVWNTRAPILSAEEMKKIYGKENP